MKPNFDGRPLVFRRFLNPFKYILKLVSGNGIWAAIWCVCNVAAYILVIFAIKKSNKMFIIPALVISVFDIIVGTIQAVIAFIKLWTLL